ncbi:type VI secretion system lipoprotein TssJ [Paraburkholderia sp. FT54]|uniref:type VI secretion system lipoprotein TssJ n=1 Tax=Paraburkholderia sp. FT54 TaxID=3074437 RepID=UPI00287795A7|nr:type VI secretion system lipoprotein TssJ [Paraburkholderia sp. FT54]WNC92000.1 type VI secretion system lipoprotein TssJ [Paraburkholderia sp. FT54]
MTRKLWTVAAALATLTVAACGVGQAVTDSAVDAAKWAFTTQVKTMNVDLVSRASLNSNGAGQALSTVVRIYQLKTPQAFQQLDYAQLQTNDLEALKADLLATKDVVLRPDASASVSEPMNSDAAYVGVVAFFRDAGRDSTWKLLIPKKQWKNTDPVRIEARDNTLKLVGATVDTIKRNAPQQSVPNPPKPKPPVSTEYGTQAG